MTFQGFRVSGSPAPVRSALSCSAAPDCGVAWRGVAEVVVQGPGIRVECLCPIVRPRLQRF